MLFPENTPSLSTYIALYSPIGIIGAWRWSVWLVQKIFAYRYEPIPISKIPYRATLSVVTPVYNEDPELFHRGLTSWKENGVDEIIAVIDATDKRCIETFNTFKKTFPKSTLIVTEEPGKRPALARGIEAAQGEILALVDSDTIWDPHIRDILLAPFADKTVGGVTTRQRVLSPKTPAERLFAIRLTLRYLHEFPYLAVVGNAFNCLSGRTAVYRKTALVPVVDEMLHETFLGKKCISGEDKRLTSLVMRDGWKLRYQKNASVYTMGMPLLSKFFKQNLRWSRNSWRTDLRMIFSSWVWKREPLFGYHLIDRSIQPFTLLLGPIFLTVSILLQHWTAASILLAWILGSRAVKLWPHLKESPGDIFTLPLFVFSQYYLAILKIYALLTLDYQSWITRWHTQRLRRGFWELFPSQLATMAILVGIIFIITQHSYAVARATEMKVTKDMLMYTDDFSFLNLDETQADFFREREKHLTTTYVSHLRDTPQLLMKRFNLPQDMYARLFSGRLPTTPIALGTAFLLPVDSLRTPLSRPLLADRTGLPYISYEKETNTIRIKGANSLVTLPLIAQALSLNPHLLEKTGSKEWILRANLYLGENVTLVIDDRDVDWLKLASSSSGFVYIRSYNGDILIENTKITSWNEAAAWPDLDYSDGRAFLNAYASGRMDIVHSEIGYLGYPLAVARKLGTFGGTYGVSWKITNGTFNKNALTGSAIGNHIHDNYFGLYAYGATALRIEDNEVSNNVQYGIDPHDDSNNLLIENNFVHGNGNHGIIVSKRVVYSTIRNNRSVGNRLHGLMLDRESNFNLVENNQVSENINGIAIYDSHQNLVRFNLFEDNRFGIRANEASSENRFEENTIRGNEKGIFLYGKSKKNVIIDNSITGNRLGVSIREAKSNAIIRSLATGQNDVPFKLDGNSKYANFIQRIQ